MIQLPSILIISNGQEIASSQVQIEFENDIYHLIYSNTSFWLYSVNGHFFNAASAVMDSNSTSESLVISEQTLNEIQKLNS